MARDFRVILVGHALSPRLGSEPGNTWNWAWELSQHVPVEVFAFPQYRKEVEEHLAENPNPRLKIRWVTLRGFDPWRPEKGERGIRLHYLLWLCEAYKVIRELTASTDGPEDTIGGFARAIEHMALDQEARNRMALAAWRFAQEERWDKRAERMLNIYEELLHDAHCHL